MVDIAAEVGGDAGVAVTTEGDPQATVTKRMSTHRIAPLIVRNTPILDSSAGGVSLTPSPLSNCGKRGLTRGIGLTRDEHGRSCDTVTAGKADRLQARPTVVEVQASF